MKISALEEYGLRCLLRLGQTNNSNSLTINEIAVKERLSVANVRKLMMILRELDLVESVRGRSGGYALKSDPKEISVGQVLEQLGGRMYDKEFCGRHSGQLIDCTHTNACSVRSLWAVLDGLVGGVLGRISLADLIGDERKATLSLRGHLRATIVEMLGQPVPGEAARDGSGFSARGGKADPSLRSG
ncbi:MAG TPA: Rrf2 family transcriptional regulator [Acidobacteriota bacterium]|nr:Rrf2 family transcriptional regulator [Acidobacteriota bacterium]